MFTIINLTAMVSRYVDLNTLQAWMLAFNPSLFFQFSDI